LQIANCKSTAELFQELKGGSMGISGIKKNHKKGIAAAAKARRREEALARQAQHDKLSLEDKIRKARPGSKEHVRLLSQRGTNG
jgi:hypothetical protein